MASITTESDPESLFDKFLIIVLMGPMLETLMFQWFLLLLAKKISGKITGTGSWLPAFMSSSLIFAASHAIGFGDAYLGFLRALPILPAAFVFSLLAIIERERDSGNPVLLVFLLHSLSNFFWVFLIPDLRLRF